MLDEAQDVGLVVKVAGVVGDAAAFVRFDTVLVYDPVQGGAVAQFVLVYLGRDAAEGEELVVFEFGFVFAQAHLFYAVVEWFVRVFDVGERVFRLFFVVDVNVGQPLACLDELPEMFRPDEGDAGQFAAQVGGVGFAVGGMVQQGVDVVEDGPFVEGVGRFSRKLRVSGKMGGGVHGAELLQRPIGDVFAAVIPILVVSVEGEALRVAS